MKRSFSLGSFYSLNYIPAAKRQKSKKTMAMALKLDVPTCVSHSSTNLLRKTKAPVRAFQQCTRPTRPRSTHVKTVARSRASNRGNEARSDSERVYAAWGTAGLASEAVVLVSLKNVFENGSAPRYRNPGLQATIDYSNCLQRFNRPNE